MFGCRALLSCPAKTGSLILDVLTRPVQFTHPAVCRKKEGSSGHRGAEFTGISLFLTDFCFRTCLYVNAEFSHVHKSLPFNAFQESGWRHEVFQFWKNLCFNVKGLNSFSKAPFVCLRGIPAVFFPDKLGL